jgi:hypothetical protein
MKRYLATQVVYNSSDLESFNAKIESDKTKFEDTVLYKNAKKDYENALKAYDDAILKDDGKADLETLLIALEETKAIFDTLVNSQIVVKCEDSVEICPQLGERVLFVENYKEVDILEKDVIQLTTPFYFDTGTELITITKDNYKEYDIDKILIEKPEKYKEVIQK